MTPVGQSMVLSASAFLIMVLYKFLSFIHSFFRTTSALQLMQDYKAGSDSFCNMSSSSC